MSESKELLNNTGFKSTDTPLSMKKTSFELAREMSVFNENGLSFREQKEMNELSQKFDSYDSDIGDANSDADERRYAYLKNLSSYYRESHHQLTGFKGTSYLDKYFYLCYDGLKGYDLKNIKSDYTNIYGINTGTLEGLSRARQDYIFRVRAEINKKIANGELKENDYNSIQKFKDQRYRNLYLTGQMIRGNDINNMEKDMQAYNYYCKAMNHIGIKDAPNVPDYMELMHMINS